MKIFAWSQAQRGDIKNMKYFSSPEITFARAPCPADILEPIIKHFKLMQQLQLLVA